MLSLIKERSIWDFLREESRPIVLYGMGDGALKVLDACQKKGIRVSGIFASDDHVRKRDFAGFPLRSLSEIEDEFGDFVILLCFAAFREDLLCQIEKIGNRHTLLAPDVPVFGKTLFDQDFFDAHQHDFENLYEMLADDWSRKVLCGVLNFKLSGKPQYLREIETSRDDDYRLLQLTESEDYYDLGGYDGDTVQEFLHLTHNHFSSITVLEPDPKNFRKLQKASETFPEGNIRLIQAASWKKDAVLRFQNLAGRNSFLDGEGKTEVPARSVDSLAEGRTVSFIKMDVEGAEYETLLGAEQVLRRDAPKLMISAYHRSEDLIRLPELIHRINPRYRLYLRHQPYIPAWEVNLYAVV